MENTQRPLLKVSDFIALANQTLEYAFSTVAIEGEVASFKVSQNKYVFFDLKDDTGSVGCFMTVWQLRVPIEDGMRVVVTASPKVTNWGKFSLSIKTIHPSGEGNLKRSFDLLRAKLESEGLFAAERKRILPETPSRIAVISSVQAAGYADFIKIINDRWGGLDIDVAHVQVQGEQAPDQIIRALRYFNTKDILPDVIAIVRGGGSIDDLSAFNDEALVREVASSRVPTLVGIGHETDITLSELAADVRASTPSNAAQLIVPDKREIIRRIHYRMDSAATSVKRELVEQREKLKGRLADALTSIVRSYEVYENGVNHRRQVLAELDPKKVLARGYAIVRGEVVTGGKLEIETDDKIAITEVLHVKDKA